MTLFLALLIVELFLDGEFMTKDNDIVFQLRNLCFTGNADWEIDVCHAMHKAADEIERLRELVPLLKHSIEHQVCECSHCLGEEGAT